MISSKGSRVRQKCKSWVRSRAAANYGRSERASCSAMNLGIASNPVLQPSIANPVLQLSIAAQYCSIAGEVHSNTAIPPIAAGEKRTGASIRLQSAIRPVSIAIAASMYNCTCVHCNCCRKCSIFNRYFKILPASLLNHHQSTSHHPVKPRVMKYNAKARL